MKTLFFFLFFFFKSRCFELESLCNDNSQEVLSCGESATISRESETLSLSAVFLLPAFLIIILKADVAALKALWKLFITRHSYHIDTSFQWIETQHALYSSFLQL